MDKNLKPFIEPFIAFAKYHKMQPFYLEKCFSTKLFGGQVDYVGFFDDIMSIVDFKTKNTRGKPISFWPEWQLQLVGYSKGLGISQDINVKQLISVVIASDEPNKIGYKIWPMDQVNDLYRDVFMSHYQIWRWKNKWN